MTGISLTQRAYFPLLLICVVAAFGVGAAIGLALGTSLNAMLRMVFDLPLAGIAAYGLPYLLALLSGASLALAVMWFSVRQRGGFQGGHAAVCFLSIFGTIIAVNFAMATQAVRTFPGLEVANSYIASQSFDDRRAAQAALGWHVEGDIAQGSLWLRFSDAAGPVYPAAMEVVIGRPTHQDEDQTLIMTRQGEAFISPVDLAPGLWTVRLQARAEDGTLFEHRVPVSAR